MHRLKTNSPLKKYFQEFQSKAFGADVKYTDLARLFKAELFDPVAWAKSFKNAGMS